LHAGSLPLPPDPRRPTHSGEFCLSISLIVFLSTIITAQQTCFSRPSLSFFLFEVFIQRVVKVLFGFLVYWSLTIDSHDLNAKEKWIVLKMVLCVREEVN
jgi:hypothetical protein